MELPSKYNKHREDCEYYFAPLDVCFCVEKNMLEEIDTLRAQVTALEAERDAAWAVLQNIADLRFAEIPRSPHKDDLNNRADYARPPRRHVQEGGEGTGHQGTGPARPDARVPHDSARPPPPVPSGRPATWLGWWIR